MEIDWEGMENSVLIDELDRGMVERDERVKKLMGAGIKKGRPLNTKNGKTAPEGDLDREMAGDA